MTSTTNLPNGITNAADTSSMGTLTQLDPTKVHTYYNDFNLYNAADWTVTVVEAGTGSATQAIADETGGILELTNDDATSDSTILQLSNETFKFVSGKQFHFKARFKASGATDSDFSSSVLFAAVETRETNDVIKFSKSASSTNLIFTVEKNSTESTATVATDLSNDTYFEVAFIYDGRSEVQYWYNGVKIGALDTTNLPDDEELVVTFGIQNGTAVIMTMHIDYIYIASER